MKTLFVFGAALLCFGAAHAQKVLNKNKEAVGYITDEGVVQDSSHQTLGYFKNDGSIMNANYEPLGYLKPDGAVTMTDNYLLGYYKNNQVLNARNEVLGSVSGNGTVYDAKGLKIGHLDDVTDDMGAVSIFFFFHLTGVDYYNDPAMIYPDMKK